METTDIVEFILIMITLGDVVVRCGLCHACTRDGMQGACRRGAHVLWADHAGVHRHHCAERADGAAPRPRTQDTVGADVSQSLDRPKLGRPAVRAALQGAAVRCWSTLSVPQWYSKQRREQTEEENYWTASQLFDFTTVLIFLVAMAVCTIQFLEARRMLAPAPLTQSRKDAWARESV